jgi:hypothetical protein
VDAEVQGKSFKSMVFKLFRRVALALPALTAMNYVAAQVPAALVPTASAASPADTRSLNDWLMRMHQASTNRSYVGTFVVSAGGNMSSAKIWHVCEGPQQVERVEILTGAPRSIFRHNDQVVTFMPDHKVARSEKRESLGLFPELFQSADSRIGDFYKFRHEGIERVAGVDADLIMLIPRDSLRFEACMPLYGHELSASINALEARVGWTVSWHKEFVGRSALLKVKLEKPSRLLVGFEMVDKAVAREHYDVAVDGQIVGHVSSGMKSPTLDKFLGMAFVPAEYSAIGAEFDVLVRGQPKKARVVKRPFYKPRYKQ